MMNIDAVPNTVVNDLRLKGKHCDAVLQVEDVEFGIHKVILCDCSPYFLALFTRWSSSDKRSYKISGLSPETMRHILEFIYTGSAAMTEENVKNLLIAADEFSILCLIKKCISFLEERLSHVNCINIWQFTKIYYSPGLREKSYFHILDHFEEVVWHDGFLQLSVDELHSILHRDDLFVRLETTIFEVILRWIAHAPEDRARHMVTLLPTVRLALTSSDFIESVISNELVYCNRECLPTVFDADQLIMMVQRPGVSTIRNHLACPRLPTAFMFATGGRTKSFITYDIEVYDVRVDSWMNVTDYRQHPRAYHGSAFLRGCIYFIGGFREVEYLNSVCKFDLNTFTWSEVSPMHSRRCSPAVTVLNGFIYAIGGFGGISRHRSAEYYNWDTNQWTLIAPMQQQRSDTSCATLNGKIYICGGYNGFEPLQTAECYDPETNQWTFIAPMAFRRSGNGIVAYAGHIFAIGGFDGNICLCAVEAYDPQTNTWYQGPSMLTSRNNFSCGVIEGKLFVVGGCDSFNPLAHVEFFDAATNEWSKACPLETPRTALSCCVVSGLENMADFTIPRKDLPLVHLEDDMYNDNLAELPSSYQILW